MHWNLIEKPVVAQLLEVPEFHEPQVSFRCLNNPTTVGIISQVKRFRIFSLCLFEVHFNIVLLSTSGS